MNKAKLFIKELRNNYKFKCWQQQKQGVTNGTKTQQNTRVGYTYDLSAAEFCSLLATVHMWAAKPPMISDTLLHVARNVNNYLHVPLLIIRCIVVWDEDDICDIRLNLLSEWRFSRINYRRGKEYSKFSDEYWGHS